jgi:uncharacterized protein (DUF1501 family)
VKKSRRKFLKDSGIIVGGLVCASQSAHASHKLDDKAQFKSSEPKDLVICVFQRGGADGLHSIVPHGDADYFQHRPTLAVNNSINLDGFFGLNPNLSALKPIWDKGDLGIVHAVGNPSDSRSHFDAQDQMEYSDLNGGNFRLGWLAKYLENTVSENDTVFRSVSLNQSIQKAIKGDVEAITLSNLNGFDLHTYEGLYTDTLNTIESIYQNDAIYDETSHLLITAIDTLKNINPNDYPVDNGAIYENTSFANKLKNLGVIIKADLGAEIACVDIGGWDHHNNIENAYPGLASQFANGLQAFYQDMGDRMENITILCMTEFGRRVGENASNGLDHGHAGVMYAIGKQVNGGQVYTQWPGLAETDLNRGDLEVSTDFREIFAELLVKRLKLQDDISTIIPDFDYLGGIGLFKS